MLTPKKQKYRRVQRNRNGMKGKAYRGSSVSFGEFGLKTTEKGEITSRQIEAARRAMTRYIKRGGKIWIRVFPDQPVTLKGGEIRMGGGKGPVDHYIANVAAGTVLFEIDGVTEEIAREALRLAAHKMPIQTKILAK